jgi:hypothetical protein
MTDDEKPWAELHWLERGWCVFWGTILGVMVLAFAALLISVVVDETRWSFTKVTPGHICAHGQRSNCLIRTAGRVKTVDVLGSFTVTVDRAPYLRDAKLSHGPPPAVGSAVMLEDWNGRLVSVVDPARVRRHTGQWPNPRKDMLEAIGALALVLVFPALIVFNWLSERVKCRRAAAVTGQHAQTS